MHDSNKQPKSSALIAQGFVVSGFLFLTGCATIISGTTQTVSIETNPPGAACTVKRVKGSNIVASLGSSPGTVELEKTKYDLRVECDEEGHETGVGILDSGVEGATLGNILLGGGIGWAVDSAVGADNHYPESIFITLVKRSE